MDAEFLAITQDKLIIGMLILTRISGLFVTAIFFGHNAVPISVKAALTLILALIMTPLFFDAAPHIKFDLLNMALLVFKEFLVGALLGFSSNIVYWAARFGGGIVDMDIGYQASLMFDATAGAPTLVGEFYAMGTLMIFLFLNGHHFLIESLFLSMKIVPITTFTITQSTLSLLFTTISSFMVLGMKIAAPVMVTLFNVNLALILLSKAAPQMNVFMLSFQIKVAAGIFILVASVPLIGIVSKQALELMQTNITTFLMSLNPALVN
ncbi:MAG: flagellar biosynthetic protein FliR [Ignavibacteria bacterium]|jgi:flagellar biosynthetic protein FliR|nr:flagellar biosynthetic protein FliR [Ignavibacteria bacterium]